MVDLSHPSRPSAPRALRRGERVPLAELLPPRAGGEVRLAVFAPLAGADVDVCAFALDGDERLADERYFIFYNQPEAPEGSIRMVSQSGTSGEARVVLDLSRLPSWVRKLAVTASIDGPASMAELGAGQVLLGEPPRAAYRFAGADFGREQSLVLCELYRRGDEWRFAAVGQGFAGSLARLLAHFGGEAAAPAPLVLPSTPLQERVQATPAGGILELGPGEIEGPAVLDRPITLAGRGATLWARSGPVLRVACRGITLRHLSIEVTAPPVSGAGDADMALLVDPGTAPGLEDILVRGRVAGLAAEAGAWRIPPALELGILAPRQSNEYRVEVSVPVACEVSCAVAGVHVDPARLPAGTQEITLRVGDVPADTLLLGELVVRSGQVRRVIPLSGSTLGAGASTPVRGRRLWPAES
jgi:stress response protein SCP2